MTRVFLSFSNCATQCLRLPPTKVAQFAHLLEALRHGAPPHGGIALGLDRLVAMVCGDTQVREAVASVCSVGILVYGWLPADCFDSAN